MAALTPVLIFPPEFNDRYAYTLTPVDRLDQSGEECGHCQREDRYTEVQFYATTPGGEPISGDACVDCLGVALERAGANRFALVHLEYEG